MNIEKIKLAQEQKTLAIYLYPDKLDLYNYILQYNKKADPDATSFNKFDKDIKEEYPDVNWSLRENIHVISPFNDIYLLWLFTNNIGDIELFLEEPDNKDFVDIFKEKRPGEDITEFYKDTREKYLKSIQDEFKKYDGILKRYDNFVTIVMNVEKKSKSNTKLFPDLDKISITGMAISIPIITHFSEIEIFNSIIPSNRFPFLYCNNFIKIFENFDSKRLNFETSEHFKGYMCIKNDLTNVGLRNNEYSEVQIIGGQVFSTSKKMYTQWIIRNKGKSYSFDTSIEFNNHVFDYKILPSLLENALDKDDTKDIIINKDNVEYSDIKTTFYVNNITNINFYLFKYMLTHNNDINIFVSLDDSSGSDKIAISKNDEFSNKCTIRYSDLRYGNIRALVTYVIPKLVSKPAKLYGYSNFPIGIPYFRVLISDCSNIDATKNFMKVFEGLLNLYHVFITDSIIAEYQEFCEDFEPYPKYEKQDKELKLKDLYENAYPPKGCSSNKHLVQADPSDSDAIKFPRDPPPENAETERYQSDGYQQHYVKCEDPDNQFIHVGVKKNNVLSDCNKDTDICYEYVPCCYKKDQSDTDNWKSYFNYDIEKTRDFNTILQPGKMLESGQKGYFDCSKYLNCLINQTEGEFLRMGVFKSNFSLLHCVLYAIDKNYRDISKENKEQYVSNQLQKLADNYHYGLQSHYMTEHSIVKKNITEKSGYFDPRVQIFLLEIFYNVNIIVFNDTYMVSPLYIEGYYKNITFLDKPYIFVFENTGNQSFSPKIPQCEIILYQKKSMTRYINEPKFLFNKEDPFVSILLNSFLSLNKCIMFDDNKFINIEYIPDFFSQFDILSQRIDTYGKCRGVSFVCNGINMTAITSSMPILPVPLRNEEFYYISKEQLESFVKDSKDIVRNSENSFSVNDNAITFEILIKEDEKVSMDYIQLFNKNRKNARYLVQFMFKQFAKWVLENKANDINELIISNFIDKKLIVQQFDYPKIMHTFENNKDLFNDEGKLIISSEELLKRLIYVLQLALKNDKESVLSFANQRYLTNYYSDISDFTNRQNQVIIKDLSSYDTKWYDNNYTVYYMPSLHDFNSSYFLNVRIKKEKSFARQQTYLAQTSLYLNEVKQLGIFYKRNKYNINYINRDENVDDVTCNFYNKLNEDNEDNTFICVDYDKDKDLDIISYNNTFTILMNVE
jgi:hypothetical protein